MSYQVIVIGCGGIGSYVLEMLPQVMACLNLDLANEASRNTVLASEGLEGYVSNLFSCLKLVDGDSFTGHNALRQAGTTGSKVALQMEKIRRKDAFSTWLNTTCLVGYEAYVTPENIKDIILGHEQYGATPVIFLCVDNHRTRYEVSRFMEDWGSPCLLINGGNGKITGNVTIYQRDYGDAYDPPLYKVYPEVTEDADRRPDEIHCDEVHVSNDQTAIINNMIATVMLNMFRKYVMVGGSAKAFNQKLRQKGKDGQTLYQRKNEVIIDLENNTMMTLSHAKDLDNRRVPVTEVADVPENAKFN